MYCQAEARRVVLVPEPRGRRLVPRALRGARAGRAARRQPPRAVRAPQRETARRAL
jgi:hypothetical protein